MRFILLSRGGFDNTLLFWSVLIEFFFLELRLDLLLILVCLDDERSHCCDHDLGLVIDVVLVGPALQVAPFEHLLCVVKASVDVGNLFLGTEEHFLKFESLIS